MSRKPSLLVVFLTVFIDLIGFGIVLPLLPLYAESYGARGWQIGLLMAAYSAMQFLFAPWWGRLSDRIGRRPVLLVSTIGAVASYALFAWGADIKHPTTALWIIIASRAFAGLCGANITVAQAYIADITPPEQRSKRMGLIGMAFGLGFIFGPPIGGLSFKWLGPSGPGLVAAGLCAANFILAYFILPESWTPSSEKVVRRARLEQWRHTLRQPTIGLLVIIFFLATFCFTCFELTLGLVIAQNFNLGIQTPEAISVASTLFMYCGIVGAFIQGGPIGKIVKRFGERKLIAVSLLITGLSLAPIPFIHGTEPLSWAVLFSSRGGAWWALLLALGALSIGSGLTRPPLFGLLSVLTPRTEQGATLGIAQSAGSLARIAGPIFAGMFFKAHASLPYVTCAVIAFLTGLIAWKALGVANGATPAPDEKV